MPLVRPATALDTHDVATVHVESWRAGYRGILPDEELEGVTLESRLDWWTHVLSEGIDGFHILVVEDGAGCLQGFGSACRSNGNGDHVGEIAQLYLAPAAWGSGQATLLLEALEDDLRARDFTEVELNVARGNARARRFYERCGWNDTGAERRETVWGVEFVTTTYRIDL